MAGAKGRSGGSRPGAGRKPKEVVQIEVIASDSDDPKSFLIAMMNNQDADPRLRADAAKALLPYVHVRKDVAGKKEERKTAAGEASKGRFAPKLPPKLVVNNR